MGIIMKRYIKADIVFPEDEEWDEAHSIARDPSASTRTLVRLAEDPKYTSSVASNPNAPIELLEKLAREEASEHVLDALAINPSSTSTVLDLISRKCDWHTCGIIIKHPNVSFSTLYRMSKSKDYSDGTRKAAREKLKSLE